MKKVLIPVFLFAILFASCSSDSNDSGESKEPTIEEINAMVPIWDKYAFAMNQEKYEDVVALMIPDSPAYKDAEKELKDIFAKNDYRYRTLGVEVKDARNKSAMLEATVLLTNDSIPEISGSKMLYKGNIQSTESGWKLYSLVADPAEE